MIAVVFPGQGSQAPGMGQSLYESDPIAKAVFDEVSTATGLDLALLCFTSDETTLRSTENAQLALFTASLAAYQALMNQIDDSLVKAAAGHSVGEYAALTAAGVLTVHEGAHLVQERGRLMAQAGKDVPGTMAAILGLERSRIEEVCSECQGVCVIANDNSPGQVVISGDKEGVAECSNRLAEAGAKRVVPLNVSGAFHSPLMKGAAEHMATVLKKASFSPGKFPVYSNVTAKPGSDWCTLLQLQLSSPVRWTETIQNMASDGATTFIESGHGAVLTGLIKRIAPQSRLLNVRDQASLDETMRALEGATV